MDKSLRLVLFKIWQASFFFQKDGVFIIFLGDGGHAYMDFTK